MITQIAKFMEVARQRLANGTGSMFLRTATQKGRETYLDSTDNELIRDAVKYASMKTGIDAEDMARAAEESLRFRVLAGTLDIKITIPDEEPVGKICGCQSYDAKMDAWPCKVPGNQEAADNWHKAFGNGPHCPFWEDPTPEKEDTSNQLTDLWNSDEELEQIWRDLGLLSPGESSSRRR